MRFGLSFLVSIIIAVYLAIDAPKHNKRPWLWAILGFIFGPITLGIYLIQTGRKVLGWVMLIVVGLLYIFVILMAIIAVALFSSAR